MKRSFDLLASALGLLLFAPLLLVLALAVWISSGRPILFRQQRVGRHGRDFTLLKFRTMRPAAPPLTSDLRSSVFFFLSSVLCNVFLFTDF